MKFSFLIFSLKHMRIISFICNEAKIIKVNCEEAELHLIVESAQTQFSIEF